LTRRTDSGRKNKDSEAMEQEKNDFSKAGFLEEGVVFQTPPV
jgi:hypothetical protein